MLILEDVYPAVYPKKRAEHFVHEDLLDLALSFDVRAYSEDGTILSSSALTKEELASSGISYEEMKEIAFDNFKSRYKPKLMDFDVMYVLTTDAMCYGAVYLALPEVIEALADSFAVDLCVIPSSTEELILLELEETDNAEEVNAIIRSVNADPECINEDTYLSDNAYLFSRRTGKITKW